MQGTELRSMHIIGTTVLGNLHITPAGAVVILLGPLGTLKTDTLQ